MLSTPEFLSECYELWKLGFAYSLVPGLRIARGFSDIGYEEYSVLNEHKAISLLAGTPIALDEFYLNYYFIVPTADQIFDQLYSKGWDVQEVQWKDQRTWEVKMKFAEVAQDSQILISSGSTLIAAGIDALIRIVRSHGTPIKNS